MPKCEVCTPCTGIVNEWYVECTGTCVACGADEKTAGVFRRSDKDLWCADDNACKDRLIRSS